MVDGKKEGYGKEYNLDGSLRYEGWFEDGGISGENCKIMGMKGV